MLDRSEALEIVAIMRAETPRNAAIRLMELALKIGRMTDGAKEVYREELKHLKGN